MYNLKTSTAIRNHNTKLDLQSFTAFHEQYRGRLLNHMISVVKNRDAAADITATAFASAFKNRATFRGQSSFYTWLHAIALNVARTSWRRDRPVSLELIADDGAIELLDADLPTRRLEQSELCIKIRTALREIPVIYRRVLTDHFIDGLSVRHIARRNRIPVGTVLSRISSGKRILRQKRMLRQSLNS
jgi:RNA polymerase sigma-70 factor (ECF subfamily)